MDTYLLATNVGILLGVLGLVLLVEKRRRSNLEQFGQVTQLMTETLKALQEIHSSNNAHLSEVKQCIQQAQGELKSSLQDLQISSANGNQGLTSSAKEMNDALRNEVRNSIEKLSAALLTSTGVLSKTNHELKSEIVGGLQSLCDSIGKTNRDLSTSVLKEVSGAAKKIDELKASLEESIKF
jgi:phage-related protein